MYHGIVMGLAWGVFAPISIFIPFLRKIEILQKGNRWLQIHFATGMAVALLSTVGLALAAGAKSPTYSYGADGDATGDMHVAMGIMVFSVLWIQALMGCAMPRITSEPNCDSDTEVDGRPNTSTTGSKLRNLKQQQYDSDTTQDQSSVESCADTSGQRRGLRTMFLSSKVFDDDGMLVPSLSRYTQYLPSWAITRGDDKSVKAESTTILSTALMEGDDGKEIRVAELSPLRTAASSNNLETVEVIDFSPQKRSTTTNYSLNLNENTDGGEVSELESLPPTPKPAVPPTKKSDCLLYWTYTHRFLGFGLFAIALYTCNGGIVLQSEIASDEGSSSTTSWSKIRSLSIFWGITSGITAFLILFGLFYPRVQGRQRDRPDKKRNISLMSTASGECSC
jgi:hypothetical protein